MDRWRRGVGTVLAVAVAVTLACSPAEAAPGAVDGAFGAGGVVVTDLGGAESAAASAVQPDGKIVVTGTASPAGDILGAQLLVARYTQAGKLDATFGGGGVVRAPVSPSYGDGQAIAVHADGRILVAGLGYAGTDVRVLVMRLTPSGALDRAFGDEGVAALGADGLTTSAHSVSLALAPDGGILVAYDGGDGWALRRLNPSGAVDATFDPAAAAAWASRPRALAVQPDGRILVAGEGGPGNLVVQRFLPDGASDSSWIGGDAGFQPYHDRLAMALQPDGRVVVAGTRWAPPWTTTPLSQYVMVAVRFTATGTLDRSFSDDGVAYVGDGTTLAFGTSVAIQPDGAILIGGESRLAVSVARLLPSGKPDLGFGSNGRMFVDLRHPSRADSLVLTAGRAVAVGTARNVVDTDVVLVGVDLTEPPPRSGYWMVGASGAVHPFGDAVSHGRPQLLGAAVVDLEATPDGDGYWILDDRGRVHAHGTARWFGDGGAKLAGERITSISALPSGSGYWLFTNRGRVIPKGSASSHGDMLGASLNGPVLDSVATPSGNGYYMVASDGGIFSFGDAAFHGSMGGIPLNAPVRSLVPDPDGSGYWLVAGDGGVFAFRAGFRGSMGGTPLNRPVVGMVSYGNGYLMVAADGGIFNFSNKPYAGSLGSNPPAVPIVGVAVLDDDKG